MKTAITLTILGIVGLASHIMGLLHYYVEYKDIFLLNLPLMMFGIAAIGQWIYLLGKEQNEAL